MSTRPVVESPRISWYDVPRHVRAAIGQALGCPVSEAVTQVGGFSPGAAVRVVCEDGRRAFVKAVGLSLNPETPGLNRAEVRALALLPDDVPAPKLLGSYDDGDWVALVLEDIEGLRPALPWAGEDVAMMAATLGVLSRTTGHQDLPEFAERTGLLPAWDNIVADSDGIDPRLLERLPEMTAAQVLAADVTRGSALVHWDARNDNVLIREKQAVLLDWAWACRGAPWLDTLLLALDFEVQGGPDADDFLRRNEVTREVPAAHLRSVVACLLGLFADRARRPAPPGLPTIRMWQAHCRDRALRWVDEGAVWT
jgi:hypothetical protein